MRAHRDVVEYQVRVDATSSLTQIAILIEARPEATEPLTLAQRLEGALQTAFNLRIPVTSVPAGSLPRFEMKAKRWVRG